MRNPFTWAASLIDSGYSVQDALRKVTESYLSDLAGLGVSTDAFGRTRVSNPVTLFDSKQLFDAGPLFWDDQEESGASTTSSHSTATASTTIGVAGTTAGLRTRQTFMRFNYQPGKSQLIFCTFVLDKTGGGVGIDRRIGIFDDDNGIFLWDDEGTYKFVQRTSTSGSPSDTTAVAQSSWNLDKMDGTGVSNKTLDFTKSQILVIDFEWLGVGRVRCGFVIDGSIYYAHEFRNTNNLSQVYMSTPNLPLRYQIENDGTGAASTLEHICSSVISEGGQEDNGILRYSSTDNTQVDCAVVGTLYVIKGIRLKSTHLDAVVKLASIAVTLQSASDDIEWRLVFDPTIGGSPSWSNETNSAVQTMTGATTITATGGYTICGGYISTGTAQSASSGVVNTIENALLLGSSIAGTAQTICLCAKSLTAVNALVEGSINWRELS